MSRAASCVRVRHNTTQRNDFQGVSVLEGTSGGGWESFSELLQADRRGLRDLHHDHRSSSH